MLATRPGLGLLRNLAAGLRLVGLRPLAPDAVSAAPGNAAALILVSIVAACACDLAITPAPSIFDLGAVHGEGFDALLLLGLAALAARVARRSERTLLVFVALLSMSPWIWLLSTAAYLLNEGSQSAWSWALLWGGLVVWYAGMVIRVLDLFTDLGGLRSAALGGLYSVLSVVLSMAAPTEGFWIEGDPDPSWPVAAERKSIDAEALLYAQPDRVAAAVAALAPQRPGVADLYFLGFAADARQDVFRKEVDLAQQTLDARFDTAGRSLLLVNHADTAAATPLATVTNLRRALALIGQRLDPAEDFLFLFLTGHGSQEQGVATAFPRLPLNPVEPNALAAMLAESGIRWRIVVVSACHSGVFVDPLRDAASIVLTASAADRRSFGCAPDAESTYFGRALFAEALATPASLLAGFEDARHRVYEREAREKLTHSSPQIAVGPAIAAKLAEFEARLLLHAEGDLANHHAGLLE